MTDQSDAPPRTTVLHARHEALSASFTDFGGWLMPVRYTSDLAEHHAVRTAAGLFDISHMAEFLVTGHDAAAFLDYALAGAISLLAALCGLLIYAGSLRAPARPPVGPPGVPDAVSPAAQRSGG